MIFSKYINFAYVLILFNVVNRSWYYWGWRWSVYHVVELVRNLVAHSDAWEGKWRGNWRMEWVASTLKPTPNVVYPALLKLMRTPRLPAVDWTDAPHRFKRTRPFRGKTKSGFCACAITFRTSYNTDFFCIILCSISLLSFPERFNFPHSRFVFQSIYSSTQYNNLI